MSEQSQVVDSTVDIPTTGSYETTDAAIKDQMQDVGTMKERHHQLERIIDKLIEALKRNINNPIEVDGKEIPLDECAAKIKTLSSCGSLNDGSGLQDDQHHNQQPDLPKGSEDTQRRPIEKMDDHEVQIEMLKAEIELLRATLQEASEREHHYKILVGQLDMADSRAQQKWESFHNGVVQQWSDHCQMLQRQLSFAAMKLQQRMTTEQAREQTSETENESNSANEAICLENGQVSVTAASAPPLSESSDDVHEEISDGHVPHPSARPPMIPAVPGPPFPVFSGQALSPFPGMPFHGRTSSPYTNIQPPPPATDQEDEQDQPFISEKLASARQLHRFFTNLSLIEVAQREGRAYLNSDQDYRDQDTDRHIEFTEYGHNPRRARVYGCRSPTQYNDQYDEGVAESEPFLDASSVYRDTKPNRLTPTATPFIPASARTRNIDEH